jgi:DinB superfamily
LTAQPLDSRHTADKMDAVYGRPEPIEAPEYFSKYILKVPGSDLRQILHAQLVDTLTLMDSISDDRSRHRYTDGKWSIREVLGHINDTERVFVFRGTLDPLAHVRDCK